MLRSVVQRMERLLAGLERMKRQPNRRESYHLRHALEHLQAERFEDAEGAVTKAEHAAPLPAHVASILATNQSLTIEELRSQLDRVTKARDSAP